MKQLLKNRIDVPLVYLKVAEGGVYPEETLVQTVLGSCLGGVFHVPGRGIGAFFHAFLPRHLDYEQAGGATPFKYVDTAFEYVMRELAMLGVRPGAVRVSLVGGASGLVDEQSGVGRKNVEAAMEALDRLRIRPFHVDTGGESGRKVYFLTSTGEMKIVVLDPPGSRQCAWKPGVRNRREG